MRIDTLEEDTGSGIKVLRGAYDAETWRVLLNIEVPNGIEPTPVLIGGVDYNAPPEKMVNMSVFLSDLESPEEISQGLKDLARVRDLLAKRGYHGKFHEEEGLLEYSYEIPYINQDHLNQILREVSHIDNQGNGSPAHQLEQLFAGKLDSSTLETLVKDVDSQMQRVTVETGSTGVVSFVSDGKKAYGKVSTSKPALINEEKAINSIQTDKIARVLAPVPIGLVLAEDAGALFTWGTENKGLYQQGDIDQYFSLFNTLLFQYAQQRRLDLAKLAKDPTVRDVFNRAIINTSLRDYVTLNPSQSIYPVEILEDRASNNDGLLNALREHTPVYIDASKRAATLNPGKRIFLHGDARPENIGKDPNGIRPLIDWSNARMGSFAEDLSALEVKSAENYLDWYKFVIGFRGADFTEEDSKELLMCHEVMQPYRTGSFKISKGRLQEAQRDIRRLQRNAARYKERFG